MFKRVLAVAGAAYLVSLVGAWLASGVPQAVVEVSPPPRAAAAPRRAPLRSAEGLGARFPLRGFAIGLHHTDHFRLYLEAVDRIAEMGFDSMEVVTPAFQTDGVSADVRMEAGPGRGADPDQLVTLLRYARSRGMTTALMPVVLLSHPRDNEWRGKIHPERWDEWWAAYGNVVDGFVDLANQAGVDIFSVGSELLTTEGQQARWVSLIERVRRRFGGLVTYSTNWDHYPVMTAWDRLDLIGISGYWDITTLTDAGDPSPEGLTRRWRQIREKVLAFAEAQGRPVLFTEVGYPSLPWGLKDPWNYVNSSGIGSDGATQAMGYAAFLSAWGDVLRRPNGGGAGASPGRPLLGGVFFYEWDPYHAGGPGDTGYGVRGKPAEKLLRAWLGSGG